MRYHIIILMFLFAARPAAGQSLADLERQLDSLLNQPVKSEVVIGLGFGNNPAYGGKSTDPFRPLTTKPFLSPNVSYNHKSGLYASAYGYYLLNATRKPWFEMDLSAGYDYTKNRDFLTGVSYTRYFYTDSSDIPATPIINEAFAYFFYRKWWLEPGLSLDLGWGTYKEKSDLGTEQTVSGSDFNVIVDMRHSFIYMDLLKNDDALLIMPVASFTMGTANYYSNLKSTKYVSRSKMIPNRKKKQGNNGNGNGNGNNGNNGDDDPEEITISDNTGFRPRAVDLGVRMSYIIGRVAISPSYTVFKLLQGGDAGITGYFTASVSVTL